MKILPRLAGMSLALALFAAGCEQGARLPTATVPPTDDFRASRVQSYDRSQISAASMIVPESQVERSVLPLASLVVNGSFEEGGGSFIGWTVFNQPDGSGDWFIQSGTTSPVSGFDVPPPPDGTHAAMTDQGGPGSHILYQDVTIPAGGAELRFDLFIGNRADAFYTPPTLRYNVDGPNQQFRMDIMDPSAPIASVGAGVLMTVYHTQPGDPLISGYQTITASLDAFAGQTIRLRFAEVDNQFFFQVGVDNVQVNPREAPPCTPVTLDAVYSGPPARMPGLISLSDQFVFVEIYDIESHLPRTASPQDVRIGDSWETGTPAEGFQVLDIDSDGKRDIRLRFSISQLTADGNLSGETTEVAVWGRDSTNDQLYCGTAQVTVIGGDPEVLFYDNFDQENNGVGQLNYFGFTQWNVVEGSVDLLGPNLFDLYPGNGLYVDLDGSIGIAGRMETKTEFTLTPATYVLEFQLGGSQRGDTNTVEVSLGSVYSESFTLPSNTPLTTYTRSIPVASTTSARIVFDHAGGDNLGLILAEVRLSRAP